jgi:cyanate permease
VGIIAFIVSLYALPFITEPWQLFAAYAVMAFGWATMSLGAITNILGLWFEEKRGLAISLALSGASFGGVIVVPALVFVAAADGFALAMIGAAFAILIAMLPIVSLLGTELPRAVTRHSSGEDGQASILTRRAALRTRAFWSIAAPFALALLSQVGFLVHQIAFLEPTIGRASAGIAVAITTGMAIIGRLVLGAFAHFLNQRIASALSLVSQAAAIAVMTQAQDVSFLYAASAVYGFSVGNMITFPALIIQREFEARAFGMLIGLSTGLAQFTYAFGPALVGLLRDFTGSYPAAFSLCVMLNLIAATIVWPRPHSAALASQ